MCICNLWQNGNVRLHHFRPQSPYSLIPPTWEPWWAPRRNTDGASSGTAHSSWEWCLIYDCYLKGQNTESEIVNLWMVRDFFDFCSKFIKTNFCLFQSEFPFVFWILEKSHFLWEKVLNFKIIHICLYDIKVKDH